METGRHPLVLLQGMLLLLAVAHGSVLDGVKTVLLAAGQCGQTLYLDNTVHTYRVLMADAQSCPNIHASPNDTLPHSDSFACSVHFTVKQPESTIPQTSKLCMDFSRMRLTGDNTTLSFDRHSYMIPRLTSRLYPLAVTLEPKRCLKLIDDHTLSMTFRSDCGHNLRHFFSSWIYIYLEPATKPIFHVDGSCRHRTEFLRHTASLLVRSYLWSDTVREPDTQDCSLEVRASPYYSQNSVRFENQFCMRWDFNYKSCGLAAYRHQLLHIYMKRQLDFDSAATCADNFDQRELDACNRLEVMRPVLVAVSRNRTQAQELFDGELFFQTTVTIKHIRHFEYDYPDSDEPRKDDFDFSIDVVVKVCAPIAVLLIVCCMCGVARKRKHDSQQQQADPAPVSSYSGAGLRTQPPDAGSRSERVALNPLTPGGQAPPRPYTYQPHPPPPANQNAAWMAGANRSALDYSAPPLSYEDAMAATPSVPSAPPPFSPSPPPPPSTHPSSPLPAAPPAYNDLFPSHV